MWAEQCKDPRYFAQWQKRWEESQQAKDKEHRPPLAGYSAFLSEIRGLRNDLRAANRMRPLLGPLTPIDEIKARKKEISDRTYDRVLGYDTG